eukprot:6471064-Amphidinium_carterae.3
MRLLLRSATFCSDISQLKYVSVGCGTWTMQDQYKVSFSSHRISAAYFMYPSALLLACLSAPVSSSSSASSVPALQSLF